MIFPSTVALGRWIKLIGMEAQADQVTPIIARLQKLRRQGTGA